MDHAMLSLWEPVIGLEIHVELNTKSKLFSSAPNRFGDEPNCNISEVCTGQPGALPVVNQEAVRKAVLFGCAISAKIARYSRFDRKSYFYPDSPRNFQITQFEMPIILGGEITINLQGEEKSFAIDHAHLEDDAGMLKHFGGFAAVDYNRAGVPLIEIVSKPCLHSAADAIAYAQEIKAILEYLDVSDCNMEEGSLRMDINISVRPKGESGLRNKIEIKNVNSFNFLGKAIEMEFKNQVRSYLENPDTEIVSSTYRFDSAKGELILMRRKEKADDYRYFLEPDLPPLILEDEYIEGIKASLPELPSARLKRYMSSFTLAKDTAELLVKEKKLADYFEEALAFCDNAKALANWITVEFSGRLKEKSIWQSALLPKHVAELVCLIDKGEITGKIAKSVADEMIAAPQLSPKEIIQKNPDFMPVTDSAEIEQIVDKVLAENQQSVTDFLSGKTKAFAYLVGQVMKETKGKAPPALVHDLLKKKIE